MSRQPAPVWQPVDAATYTAESAVINGHLVTVCLDDEGPMSPAFYWDIDNRATDGWARSVFAARRDAVRMARLLPSAQCTHCGRTIVQVGDVWVDNEATGDDVVWRETCDAHDTFTAEHEPSA